MFRECIILVYDYIECSNNFSNMKSSQIPFILQLTIVIVLLCVLEGVFQSIPFLLGFKNELNVLISVPLKVIVDVFFVVVLWKIWNINVSTKLDKSTFIKMFEVLILTSLYLIIIFPFSFPFVFFKTLHDGCIQIFDFKLPSLSNFELFYLFSIKAIIIPIVEELFFRGIIQSKLQKKYLPFVSILIASFIFALCHWSLTRFIRIFLTGLLLGEIFQKYKSIYLSIFSHIIINSIAFFSYTRFQEINEKTTSYVMLYLLCWFIFVLLVKVKRVKLISINKK